MIYMRDQSMTCPKCSVKTDVQEPKRVLLVEDDVHFAKSMVRLLALEQIDALVVHTGKDALVRLEQEPFDLALVDVNLPDMRGHQVIEHIKLLGVDTAAIVVSGETEIEAAIQALRAGALDFLRKPVEPALLLHAVHRALQQRSVERVHRKFEQRVLCSERLHRFLVDRSPDLIFILDQNGQITYINDRLESALGEQSQNAIGKHFSVLVFEDDQDRSRYAFSSRKLPETAKYSVEFRLKSQQDNSGFRHFNISISPMGVPDETVQPNMEEGERYYGIARDITSHREVEEWAVYHANHDSLTGLPNRNLFRDRLNLVLVQARRNMEHLAVLFLNVDRFKSINDLYGHARADEMLNQIAERIQRCMRGGDTLARFGGDEFLLLNAQIQNEADVLGIVARINSELEVPFRLGGEDVRLSLSAGIALFPEHGDTAEALIRHANIALYHGRLSGSKSHTFFMHEMGASADHRLHLEQDLRHAIEQDEFVLHFQPQVDASDRQVLGVEALIRWNHPRLGLLPPGEFLSVAEETGLIVEVGEWVTREVCRSIRHWDSIGLQLPRVAINISPRQLDQPDFVDRFTALLAEYQVAPERIEVELTENLFIRDPNAVATKLQSLAAKGVLIAIDDFGTQYSSLGYLQKFPINTLKIDKSFVWEIDREYRQHAIIKAIISIAHGLGLNLIAEGVETDEQLKFLSSHGCNEIQGYLVSKPLASADLEKVLAQRKMAEAPQPEQA